MPSVHTAHSSPQKETGKPQAIFRTYEPSIKDSLTIVLEARKGVAAEAFFDVAEASLLSQNLLADLVHTSLKTLQRYRKENTPAETAGPLPAGCRSVRLHRVVQPLAR
jgi:hypothetical protein